MRKTHDLILKIFYTLILAAYGQEKNDILKSLEAERVKLQQQIHEAIEDSLLTLQKNNVSEAAEGINYLNNLKKQFLEINSTGIFAPYTSNTDGEDLSTNNVTKDIASNSSILADLRRAHAKFYHKTTKPDKIFDPQVMFEKIPKEKYALMLNNRVKVENKLNDWLLKRKKEKELLKAYLEKKKQMLLGGNYEKCPRFGFGKKKKKKKSLFRRKNIGSNGISNESQSSEEPQLDANLLNLFAAFLTSAATPTSLPQDNGIAFNENLTLVLAENVRRQLMKDNYDYLIDQTTATTLLTNPYHTGDVPGGKEKLDEVEITTSPSNTRTRSHLHHRHSKYVSKSNKTNNATIGIEEFLENDKIQKLEPMRRAANPSGKVKYSMLKVKGPSRRSALQPRLLKEEKDNEVSIVNLGNGPLPQFRLPRSHRQYRAEDSESDRSSSSDAVNISVSDSAVDLER